MDSETLKQRTRQFALRIIALCRELPPTREGRLIGDQLFRAGTSVGSNYRAVCRARSHAEFVAKLGTVLEEADESLYWLEILDEIRCLKTGLLEVLLREADELVSIFVASLNTAKSPGKWTQTPRGKTIRSGASPG